MPLPSSNSLVHCGCESDEMVVMKTARDLAGWIVLLAALAGCGSKAKSTRGIFDHRRVPFGVSDKQPNGFLPGYHRLRPPHRRRWGMSSWEGLR
jgi:hypothetical protein